MATHAVLTQRLLVTLIASFQRGVPGVAVPLLRRLVDDGFVRCRVRLHRVGWFGVWRESHRIVTPRCRNVRPQHAWAEQAFPEAIAMYDNEDLYALKSVFAAVAFASKPSRDIKRLLHRVAEAAAAFGRVDMLEWLDTQHSVFSVQPHLISFCVKRAVRHGHVAVLVWVESTMGSASLETLRSYDVHDVIKHRDVEMTRWLADRGLGIVSPRSLRWAAEHGDVAMLRVLLENGHHDGRDHLLVALAMRRGHYDVVEYLVRGKLFTFTTTTIEKAIALRQLEITKCLLDHRENLVTNARATLVSPSLVQQLVGKNDLSMLEMLASVRDAETLGCSVLSCCHFAQPSDDALRNLLRLSSAQDAAVTLMRFAVRERTSIVQTILTETNKPIPQDVLAFVDRIQRDELGPLASRAMAYVATHEDTVLDEILRLVTTAARDDVRDSVLRFLSGPAIPLAAVLKTDATRSDGPACDEAFLQLCLSLRQNERDAHHRAVQQYLYTRKSPKRRV